MFLCCGQIQEAYALLEGGGAMGDQNLRDSVEENVSGWGQVFGRRRNPRKYSVTSERPIVRE